MQPTCANCDGRVAARKGFGTNAHSERPFAAAALPRIETAVSVQCGGVPPAFYE